MASRRGSMATSMRRRRESDYEGVPGSVGTTGELNFAQRLLMANENAVTNIADLWVAAAIDADNEDPFEEDSEEDLFADDDDDNIAVDDELDESEMFAGPSTSRHNRFSRRLSSAAARVSPARIAQSPNARRPTYAARRLPSFRRDSTSGRSAAFEADELPQRRVSAAVPPIFAHVGVRTPPAVLEAQQLLAAAELEPVDAPAAGVDTLAPVPESRLPSRMPSPVPSEREPSLMSMLPLAIIFQYGWLALHSTTHDQVFYLYLVS